MSHTLYDAFQGMASGVITVGTLMGPFDLAETENSNDEDVFTCGKCKKQFYSLHTFMIHKKIHQLGNVSAGQKVLTETITGDSSNETDLQLPIILSESDILSFNINQSLTLPDQSLQAFEENEALIMPESEDSQMQESSASLQIRPGQIILATQVSNDDPLGRPVLLDGSSQAGPTFTLVEPRFLESTPLIVTENEVKEEIKNNETAEAEAQTESKPTKVNKLKCLYCEKSFLKNFDLQQHMRRHTGERPFQCVVCGRSFSQKSNVKKHMATHKVWPQKIKTIPEKPLKKIDSKEGEAVVVDESFACQFCSLTFVSFTTLRTHLKTHTDVKVFRCVQKNCRLKFDQLEQFLEHTAAHETEQNTEYTCCSCEQTFTSLDELGAHQQLHYNWKKKPSSSTATCRLCKAKFTSAEALEKHELEDPHSYSCPECAKQYVSERLLRRHLQSHQSAHSFTCTICDKDFKSAQSLNLHKITHSKEKPFRCKLCSAAFARIDRLKRHMFIHDASRRFKCPLSKHLGCQKEFYRQDKLKQHLLTHTTHKHLKCDRCGRGFKGAGQLKRHETVCTAEDKPCKDCGHIISGLDKYKKTDAHAGIGSHVNRRKHRLLASSKEPAADDGVPTIQVVVVSLPSAVEEAADS